MSLDVPVVIDASALSARSYPERKAPVIVTPHPGEFSRMTGQSMKDIQSNGSHLQVNMLKSNKVIVVLKGKYTVIAFPDGSGFINTTGNSALGKGGTGDTLTGMILAMLCTHEDLHSAIANAVFLHGKCAELWTRQFSESSMLASDFADLLPKVFKEIEG